ncbi:MAG: AMP-binding protein [Chloroflexi bacterium]|nr:AMP-binding protein [Chloroflexota bacterium]
MAPTNISTATLQVEGHYYTNDQLRHWSEATEASPISENTRDVLRFCHQWLTGATSFVINTSGSTGTPKPITLPREQMVASARRTGEALGLHPGQQALICMPTRYIAGRMMLVRGFVLGLAMTVVEPASDPLRDLSPDVHFDFTAVIPLQLQTLLNGPPHYRTILNRMQAILIGGGPVSPALQEQLQVITAPIYHTYGMTETITHIALRRLNGPQASEAFTPLAGVKLAVDGRGCLNIRSEITQDQVVQTNDIVELRQDGSFIWLGRWDNVINSGGVKVQVEKVEIALEKALHAVAPQAASQRRFFVGPLPDERLGERVVAVLEGAPLGEQLERALRESLQPLLTKYEVPRNFYYLPQFAETPTRKIDRKTTLLALRSSP